MSDFVPFGYFEDLIAGLEFVSFFSASCIHQKLQCPFWAVNVQLPANLRPANFQAFHDAVNRTGGTWDQADGGCYREAMQAAWLDLGISVVVIEILPEIATIIHPPARALNATVFVTEGSPYSFGNFNPIAVLPGHPSTSEDFCRVISETDADDVFAGLNLVGVSFATLDYLESLIYLDTDPNPGVDVVILD